jgi:MFS family permease
MDDHSGATQFWTKDFILTSLSNLFLFFSFHMLTPTLPLYVIEMNGTAFEAGLVVGVFTVTALMIRPFAGRALDTLGRKKILLTGLFIFGIAVMSYKWMWFVSLILLMRTIQGIGWGIATTTYGTLISDIIPAKRRAEGMGYYGLSITLPMALAPLFGIWIVARYDFTILFIVATASVVISILLVQMLQPLNQVSPKKVSKERDSLLEKSALFPSLLIMLSNFVHGGILSSMTLFGLEVNIVNVGWFFLTHAIVVTITRPIAGRIFDRYGHLFLVIPGGVCLFISLWLLSSTTNLTSLIIAAVWYGVGFGSTLPTLQAWTINRVPPERRGAANGTFFSAFDLGIGLGAIFVGLVAHSTGYAGVYRISTIFIVLYILVYVIYLILERRKSNIIKMNGDLYETQSD